MSIASSRKKYVGIIMATGTITGIVIGTATITGITAIGEVI